MTELSHLVDDTATFFAPSSTDVISTLLSQYRQARIKIDEVVALVVGDPDNVMRHFLDGNRDRGHIPSVDRLFAPAGAILHLSAEYWNRTLALTDVYEAMPQARRDYWNAQLRGEKTVRIGNRDEEVPALPEYTEDAVRPTINSLLADRSKFFAERVDGLFQGLSSTHVTNCPEGFSKRMIIAGVGSSNFHSSSKVGMINDLRAVIAKFMGRDAPTWNSTGPVISVAGRRSGQWLTVDGGALRIRTYKVGTAHLEIHPDMAYRLNQVLAGMHPRAIPAQFRTKPTKRHKDFEMMGRPLPFAVLSALDGLEQARSYSKDDRDRTAWTPIPNALRFAHNVGTGIAREEAHRVLASIGGVLTKAGDWQFDYAALPIIDEIVCSGCVPDVKAHQFYPTPESIARAAVALADIGPDDTVLEPSAGQGGLASHFPAQHHAVCVEVSKLHCDILRAKGFVTAEGDFLAWALRAPKFDCIVMNPPFSEGRARAHLEAAAGLLKPAGRIVAVLPASFAGKPLLPDLDVAWSEIYSGEFAGTSVSVVIMKGTRP